MFHQTVHPLVVAERRILRNRRSLFDQKPGPDRCRTILGRILLGFVGVGVGFCGILIR
jgi:hypothetical protein